MAGAVGLLAALAPPGRRAGAYALQRLVMSFGVAFGGVVAGFIPPRAPVELHVLFVSAPRPSSRYLLVVTRVHRPRSTPDRAEGRWRDVARDRTFVSFSLLNATFMAARSR